MQVWYDEEWKEARRRSCSSVISALRPDGGSQALARNPRRSRTTHTMRSLSLGKALVLLCLVILWSMTSQVMTSASALRVSATICSIVCTLFGEQSSNEPVGQS